VHAAIPGSRLVMLDAVGHCPNLSAPEETTAAIAAFVAT
jgi:sigma-B regulation protein RsbQ